MRPVTIRARTLARLTAFLLALAAQSAAADTLTLAWDASPDSSVTGYIVYVGTQAGVYDRTFDVGSSVSFTYLDASPGQRYYFSVAAYSPGPLVGIRSSEVSGLVDRAPVLVNPGSQIGTVGQPVTLQLSGSDPEGRPVSYGASSLPPGLSIVAATGFISGTPSAAGTFTVTASVSDGALSDAETFTWAILGTPGSPAPTAPTAPIAPTSTSNVAPTLTDPGAQVASRGAAVSLQLSARDPEGARVTFGATGLPPGLQVSAATGQISGFPSVAGNFVVTATATDGVLSDAKTFAWIITQSSTDSAAPAISITLPTRATSFVSDQLFLTIGGTATDQGRVTAVEWSSDRGGQGAATGTEQWIAAIVLQPGRNIITVRARDEAGNMGSTAILVTTKVVAAPARPSRPFSLRGRIRTNDN
jgi:hypothetical protein